MADLGQPIPHMAKQLEKTLPKRHDNGDPESVKKRDDVRKLIAQQQANDIREVMNTEAGRRFVWKLLSDARLFGISFQGELTHETAKLEGMRVFAKGLNDSVAAATRENYLAMWSENFMIGD